MRPKNLGLSDDQVHQRQRDELQARHRPQVVPAGGRPGP